MSAPGTAPRGLGDRPYLILAMVMMMWAGNAVAGRLAVGEVSPVALTSLRWVVVMGVLVVASGRRIAADLRQLRPRWRYLLAMGALGYTGFNSLMYLAAHSTTAINIGVIQGVTPVFVLLGSFLVYRTSVGLLQAVGVAITIAGVLVVATRGDVRILQELSFTIGDLWMIVASAFYAGYTVGLRRRPATSPVAFFAGLATAAFVSSLPLLAAEAWAGKFVWPTAKGWLVVAYAGLVPSLISQLLFMRAVTLIGPGRAGLFINLLPIFAALLGVAILGETFAPYHAAALALVLAGIGLAEWGRAAERVQAS